MQSRSGLVATIYALSEIHLTRRANHWQKAIVAQRARLRVTVRPGKSVCHLDWQMQPLTPTFPHEESGQSHMSLNKRSSWPSFSRASTSSVLRGRAWMAGTSPAMTMWKLQVPHARASCTIALPASRRGRRCDLALRPATPTARGRASPARLRSPASRNRCGTSR